jgi:non-canonical (house-cleaning) NTP pyrophosphatase
MKSRAKRTFAVVKGTWGVLSLDLITRSASFETAVIAAFASFYNIEINSPPSK